MVLGMARLSRVVIPGIPHHVTQRGNGRQRTFFEDYGITVTGAKTPN
jgi:hypothetical protein